MSSCDRESAYDYAALGARPDGRALELGRISREVRADKRRLRHPPRPPELAEVSRPTRAARGEAYELREALRDLSGSARRQRCAQCATRPSVGPDGWSGILRCESVWSCPVCATIEWRERCETLGATVTDLRAGGAVLALVTATVRHARGQSLADVAEAVCDAWRAMGASRPWREATRGAVRRIEVTWSTAHGWHPHVHAVVELSGGHTVADLANLSHAWRDAVARVSRPHRPSVAHGWHVTAVRESRGGRYLGDALGAELADSGRKAARASGSLVLADVARLAARGDGQARALWAEYARWSHGRRALVYSRTVARARERAERRLAREERERAGQVVSFTLTEGSWSQVSRVPWGLRAVELALRRLAGYPP